jgi:ribosomal protein L12E/L44/L45/RPP1/RPP2
MWIEEIVARKDVYIEETALPVLASAAGTTIGEAISKHAMKPRAQPSPRSNNGPPAASAQPISSQDEIKTEAARRTEMEEEAFSKEEDLGADRGWLKTQEILDGDGRIWSVTAGDIPPRLRCLYATASHLPITRPKQPWHGFRIDALI